MDRPPGETANCQQIERLLVFFACEELSAEERAAVEHHVGQCPACAASLASELRLQQVLATIGPPAERLDPHDRLLAQCRSELGEALDDAAQKPARARWLLPLLPANWFVLRPAWSAALLVLIGMAVGSVVPQWYSSRMTQRPDAVTMKVSAPPRLSQQDLETMGIAAINWNAGGSSGSPSVELHLTAEKPMELQGSLDDMDVKRVLTFVVQNGQRFDSGVRLDSLELLRRRSSDTEVRQALCVAARKDRNPGVRLKSLEALRGFEQDDAVRLTLLDALQNDDCPGVRVEAINALQAAMRAMAEKGIGPQDQGLVNVLRDRMERDPNNYIRMQSAAAIHQLGPRELH